MTPEEFAVYGFFGMLIGIGIVHRVHNGRSSEGRRIWIYVFVLPIPALFYFAGVGISNLVYRKYDPTNRFVPFDLALNHAVRLLQTAFRNSEDITIHIADYGNFSNVYELKFNASDNLETDFHEIRKYLKSTIPPEFWIKVIPADMQGENAETSEKPKQSKPKTTSK